MTSNAPIDADSDGRPTRATTAPATQPQPGRTSTATARATCATSRPARRPPAGGGGGTTPSTPAPLTPAPKRTLAKANLSGAKRSIKVRRGRFSYSFRATPGTAGEAAFASIAKVRVSARRKVTLARKSFSVGRSGKVTLRIKLSRRT